MSRWLRDVTLAAAAFACATSALAGAPQKKDKGRDVSETFRAKATARNAAVASASFYLTIQVDRYTPDADREQLLATLKSGGSAAFTEAVRKAPEAGTLTIAEDRFTIRWARQTPTDRGRVITLVVDRPVAFVGAGRPDAKPREGYDLAIIQLRMDSAGVGEGTMVAAARVKPGGPTGVEVEDYAAEPFLLTSVLRQIK